MSQKYSPNMPEEDMVKLLIEEDTGCLAMSNHGKPYVVPVSYAWLDGSIVFHCALTGKKLDILRENPQVCFLVSRHPDRSKPHHPEGECTFRFESVLCFGTARIIDSQIDRLKYLTDFKEIFDLRLGRSAADNPVTPKAAENCGCVVIRIESMTGRRKGNH